MCRRRRTRPRKRGRERIGQEARRGRRGQQTRQIGPRKSSLLQSRQVYLHAGRLQAHRPDVCFLTRQITTHEFPRQRNPSRLETTMNTRKGEAKGKAENKDPVVKKRQSLWAQMATESTSLPCGRRSTSPTAKKYFGKYFGKIGHGVHQQADALTSSSGETSRQI